MGASVLAIDIGNTNCKAALFESGAVSVRLEWPSDCVPPLFPVAAADAFVAVSSVNRQAGERIREWAASAGREAMFVPKGIPFPIRVSIDEPESVGPDRVLAAAAALDSFKSPCIVICAGTATTVDVASPVEGFLGGAIMPGPKMMARALSMWTSLLPMVDPASGAAYPGRDTRGAINAGVSIGALGAVKELLARARAAVPGARVALTGGNARFFRGCVGDVDLLEEDLVLRGLSLAAAQRP